MMKWMRLLEKHCGATCVDQPTSLHNGYLAFSWLPGSCSWPGAYACFSEYLTWNVIRSLDYAAERIFLCKVGGGYIFIHRLLQDYFVSLYQDQ